MKTLSYSITVNPYWSGAWKGFGDLVSQNGTVYIYVDSIQEALDKLIQLKKEHPNCVIDVYIANLKYLNEYKETVLKLIVLTDKNVYFQSRFPGYVVNKRLVHL